MSFHCHLGKRRVLKTHLCLLSKSHLDVDFPLLNPTKMISVYCVKQCARGEMFYVKGVITTGHNSGSHFSVVVRHIPDLDFRNPNRQAKLYQIRYKGSFSMFCRYYSTALKSFMQHSQLHTNTFIHADRSLLLTHTNVSSLS